MERIELSPDYSISRVIKGGWHLAGGHGTIDEQKAISDMRAFVEAGVTTFDCADIYTGVEELIGKFLKKYKQEFKSGDLSDVQIHTKYVPDYSALANLRFEDTAKIIDRSLSRLGVERLDLVQFSWWDYQFEHYVETALHLAELQKQGKIRYIGVTNFDAAHLKEILDAGVEVLTNQVQYSILDHRPESNLEKLSETYNIPFLCYGTVAGGFFSNRYLDTPEPQEPLENRSLVKYRLIIDEFGGYELFQEALDTLERIGNKHEVGIAEVASQYILQKPMVGAVIIGARNRNHLARLQSLTSFQLDAEDLNKIKEIVDKSEGPKGPVYDLERDKEGKHGRIMRYNLNED
ncbi:aldo/keto reductase [Roseivirga sp. E12]|uniref:aldo/keto reductase n=1 Tax=Roseivirga sp. E12 TaxID=2819237 RepID=UPI001ABC3D33|nr:aldo/keto reductase [Roseivirga sp. E12]MBO3697930.1 aldo/keto reductase [Roseivirga sp. E12]